MMYLHMEEYIRQNKLANNLRNEEYITLGNHTFLSRVTEQGGKIIFRRNGHA